MSGLDRARAALERHDWAQALDLLGSDPAPPGLSLKTLELRAAAAYGAGDFEGAVSAWEELHALTVAQGDRGNAARAAAMVALHLLIDTGLMAPVRGWLRRAERLVAGQGEVPVLAVIAMVRTYERFMSGDPERARDQAASAIDLGQRLGVLPAVVIGEVASARLRIADGDVEEGLSMLDEVAARLMGGEVDPLTTGIMYCELICAAQGLSLHTRAREWTQAMEHWRHGAAFGGINGRCRVHRAELLRVTGPCDEAEEEALGACAELRPWLRREFGWPLAELGNIRLRRGDLPGAEAAFLDAHAHAWSPHPGLALLRLAQGDVDLAASLIAEAIEHPLEMPSKERPPFGDLRLAPLLDAQAEIAAAAGDAPTLARAAEALQAIADRYSSPHLTASALLARGRCALSRGEIGAAVLLVEAAVGEWAELGAPYETACARLVLGEAHLRDGHDDCARLEWGSAQTVFQSFGARLQADRAASLLLGHTRTPAAPRQSTRLTATFLREGANRRVGLRGHDVVMTDLKGFRHLERLLAAPGREIHALDLVTAEEGSLPTPQQDPPELPVGRGDAALPVIDDQARAAYRRRLSEVEEDIEDATRMNDLGRLALAERDREYLIAELAGAVGLGGRQRLTGGTGERARTSVTRSVRYALRRLTEQHPDLGRHLDRTVRTGTYCSYRPDPVTPLTWQLTGQQD